MLAPRASPRSPKAKRFMPSMPPAVTAATKEVYPSLTDCETAVKCIASFEPVATPRSVVNSHLYPTSPRLPAAGATAFNVTHLSAFCASKRTSPAEFSHDLLSRMIAAAAPGQIVDAPTLRIAATSSGAFATDWLRIIRMAREHTTRAMSARAHRETALLRVVPPTIPRSPRSARSARPVAAAAPATNADSSPSRLLSASSTRQRNVLVPPTDGDEFRDADGRRRLFLPTVEHPTWSQHAGGFNDGFDIARCDATGRSLHDAQQQAIAIEMNRFANSGTHRQIYDCGRSLELGNIHKTVARGATVVDLSRLVNVSFNPYFSERTVANQKLPLSDAMVSRNAAIPPTIRKRSKQDDTTQRINESIAAVVEYLDAVAR